MGGDNEVKRVKSEWTMEKYKEYKDSGVQWLGEIPSHWKAVLNGRIFKEDVRKALDTDISLSLSQRWSYTNRRNAREFIKNLFLCKLETCYTL